MQKKQIKPLTEVYAVKSRFDSKPKRRVVISTDLVELRRGRAGAHDWRRAAWNDKPGRKSGSAGYDSYYTGYLVAGAPETSDFPIAEAEAIAEMIRGAEAGAPLPIEQGSLKLEVVLPREILSDWAAYQLDLRVEEEAREQREAKQREVDRERYSQLAEVRSLSEQLGVPQSKVHYGFLSDGVKVEVPAYLDLLRRLRAAEERVQVAYDFIAEDEGR